MHAESQWPYGATVPGKVASRDFAATPLRTYAIAALGAFLLTIASHGFLEFAANGGSAAQLVGLRMWDSLAIRES